LHVVQAKVFIKIFQVLKKSEIPKLKETRKKRRKRSLKAAIFFIVVTFCLNASQNRLNKNKLLNSLRFQETFDIKRNFNVTN